MIGTVITAVIAGLGGLLFQWMRERKAEAHRNKAQALSSYVGGDKTADLAEKEIKASAEKARTDAVPDFNTLR